jgi:hypothetical protein
VYVTANWYSPWIQGIQQPDRSSRDFREEVFSISKDSPGSEFERYGGIGSVVSTDGIRLTTHRKEDKW